MLITAELAVISTWTRLLLQHGRRMVRSTMSARPFRLGFENQMLSYASIRPAMTAVSYVHALPTGRVQSAHRAAHHDS